MGCLRIEPCTVHIICLDTVRRGNKIRCCFYCVIRLSLWYIRLNCILGRRTDLVWGSCITLRVNIRFCTLNYCFCFTWVVFNLGWWSIALSQIRHVVQCLEVVFRFFNFTFRTYNDLVSIKFCFLFENSGFFCRKLEASRC